MQEDILRIGHSPGGVGGRGEKGTCIKSTSPVANAAPISQDQDVLEGPCCLRLPGSSSIVRLFLTNLCCPDRFRYNGGLSSASSLYWLLRPLSRVEHIFAARH